MCMTETLVAVYCNQLNGIVFYSDWSTTSLIAHVHFQELVEIESTLQADCRSGLATVPRLFWTNSLKH